MAKKGEKVFYDPEIGEVTLRKSARSRRISIRVHPVRGVRVILPYLMPYAAASAFFRLERKRVLEILARQKENSGDVRAASPEEIERMRARAKAELPERLGELAHRYGFVYNNVTIKHNSSNWGSCSAKDNINLNLNLVRLPQVLCDYILLHELCHLRHRDHGASFHRLLEELCADNVRVLAGGGDEAAREVAERISSSRARYPYDAVLRGDLKKFRLL